MDKRFADGREFLRREGRLLERRLFATCFEGAPGGRVVDVLRGYANDDGGFGHALEPDKRCPASLPLDVEVALQAMATAGVVDLPLARGAADFLARVASDVDAGGAVPLADPVIEGYPRADHMTEWTYAPSLNPTAGLVGLLHRLGVEHPWVTTAAAWCWARLDEDLPTDAHALREILVFLEHGTERDRATAAAAKVRAALDTASHFNLDPDAPEYGVTPLGLASSAESPWRALFDEDVIQGHLDRMERDQQDDGGWPITWEPPGQAAVLEWRGIVTLENLRTLVSYGRLEAP
ncbi:hypothetical protein O7635_27230 [Asanoa sp. WMMD1127]|uniref:hypothetical protein n=1 Tax=Asanoa sp. WMMD1127 TaxID=3016107 RepID=UPI0024171DA7|nr:hypothetical protein [Asanoa sp. WMMD1127]MDG4825558.1 hypothetical protein [Asanoa sp. WMMD1127]